MIENESKEMTYFDSAVLGSNSRESLFPVLLLVG